MALDALEDRIELCDVWERVGRTPKIKLDERAPICLHVSKARYDKDLLSCLKTRAAVKRQLEIDIPRCFVSLDGKRQRSYVSLPIDVARYCNQAVMGLPVFLLSTVGFVVEPKAKAPLKIEVWANQRVKITKMLGVMSGPKERLVHVSVNVQQNSDWVVVKFRSTAEYATRLPQE